jgi:hypothetical protein
MTVAYENTSADAAAWYAYYLFQTPPGRRVLRRRRLAMAVLHAAAVFLITSWLVMNAWWPLVWSLITATLGYLLAPLREKTDAAQEAQRMEKEGFFRLFLGAKQITLLPDGVHTVWQDGEIVRKWHALSRWTSTDSHIILHWSDTEDDFSLIPKRAFHGAEQCRRFLELLEGYRSGTVAPVAVPASSLATTTTALASPATATASSGGWWRDRNQVGDAPLLEATTRRDT